MSPNAQFASDQMALPAESTSDHSMRSRCVTCVPSRTGAIGAFSATARACAATSSPSSVMVGPRSAPEIGCASSTISTVTSFVTLAIGCDSVLPVESQLSAAPSTPTTP